MTFKEFFMSEMTISGMKPSSDSTFKKTDYTKIYKKKGTPPKKESKESKHKFTGTLIDKAV